MFATFENGAVRAHLDEYSEVNIEFHQTIIQLSRNGVLIGSPKTCSPICG